MTDDSKTPNAKRQLNTPSPLPKGKRPTMTEKSNKGKDNKNDNPSV